jgi:hypothetical protein
MLVLMSSTRKKNWLCTLATRLDCMWLCYYNLIDGGLRSLPLRRLAPMSEYQACPALYCPSPGDEDHRRHSAKSNSYFYTVGLGFTRGIYTDE